MATAAGGVVGGGIAAGPVVMAGAPALIGSQAINRVAFKESEDASESENYARVSARRATNVGAVLGLGGTVAATLSRGLSGPAVATSLKAAGALIGGGAMTGIFVLAAVPVVSAGALGAGVYAWQRWGAPERDSATPAQALA